MSLGIDKHRSIIDFTTLAQTITATLKFNKDKFAELSATTEATKYGTYTVTISEVPTVTWKPLSIEITTTTGKETVNYLPVFANDSAPAGITFAYKDGENYTEIPNVTKMSDIASYANAGTLYYKATGTATLFTVRSVNGISWDSTFKDNSGSSYPYHASTAYGDLQDGIKAKIASDGSETVEKLVMESSGAPSQNPTINGVGLYNLWQTYNPTADKYAYADSNKFESKVGEFISCVKSGSVQEYSYYCYYTTEWEVKTTNAADAKCVLVSRTFN